MAWIKDRMIANGQVSTKKLSVVPLVPELTVGAESANAINVVVQMQDPDGNDVEEAVELLCIVRTADGLLGLVGSVVLTEVGDGAAVSTSAKPTLIISTSSLGRATVRIATSATGTYYLQVTPVNRFGSPAIASATFA